MSHKKYRIDIGPTFFIGIYLISFLNHVKRKKYIEIIRKIITTLFKIIIFLVKLKKIVVKFFFNVLLIYIYSHFFKATDDGSNQIQNIQSSM